MITVSVGLPRKVGTSITLNIESLNLSRLLLEAFVGTFERTGQDLTPMFPRAGSGIAALVFKDSPLKAVLWSGLASFAAHLLAA